MKKYIYILFLAIVLNSCLEKEIDFEGKITEPVISVSAFFSPDSTFSVILNFTQSVVGSSIEDSRIKDAIVEIYLADELIETLTAKSGGYIGVKYPEVGKTYTLKVSGTKYPDVDAKVYVPKPVLIESVTVEAYVSDDEYNYDNTKARIRFTDPLEDKPNYYMIVVRSEGTDSNGKLVENIPVSLSSKDPVLVGNSSHDLDFNGDNRINMFAVFSDELIDGKTHDFEITFSQYAYIDDLVNKNMKYMLYSINEDYYKFLRSYENILETEEANPFIEPYVLWSNINNGVGIAAAYSLFVKKIPLIENTVFEVVSIDNLSLDTNIYPMLFVTNKTEVDLYISLYRDYSLELYKDGKLFFNGDFFNDKISGLEMGINSFIIKVKNKLGLELSYNLIIKRVEV